ncbi:MAG: Ig-like domain repeat protein [Terriglobales bacterium]
MKKIVKVLAVMGVAGCLATAALGQAAFNIVRVANSQGNTSTAINNAGDVIVDVQTPTTVNVSLWNRLAGQTTLGMTGGHNSGVALNSGNDVAGVGQLGSSSDLQAFLWDSNGGTQWLGTLGGSESAASGVNASREVVGMSYTAANLQHAFLWTESGGMTDLTPSLTSAGGATAMGINDSGEVVGYYYPNGATNVLGFNWTQANGFQSFGVPGTLAMAVNDSGTIVGRTITSNGDKHAFSWTESGGMVDLGTLGGDMSTALAINNKGWIVGTSLTTFSKNVLNGFLWTPSGGMQSFVTLAKLWRGTQPYSMQVNDYGDIALTTTTQLIILMPHMTPSVTSSANPAVAGQAVTLTVTVSSIAGPPPDGETLEFRVGGKQVGTGTLNNGVAQCTITGLTHGSHRVEVVYNGDAYYLSFANSSLVQVVN